jgi:hypothetical protein
LEDAGQHVIKFSNLTAGDDKGNSVVLIGNVADMHVCRRELFNAFIGANKTHKNIETCVQ